MYGSKTDKGRGTTHAWCEHCDWGRHGKTGRARRAKEKRAWLIDAWTEARFGDIDPRHAAMPVFVQVKFTDKDLANMNAYYDEDYACF